MLLEENYIIFHVQAAPEFWRLNLCQKSMAYTHANTVYKLHNATAVCCYFITYTKPTFTQGTVAGEEAGRLTCCVSRSRAGQGMQAMKHIFL